MVMIFIFMSSALEFYYLENKCYKTNLKLQAEVGVMLGCVGHQSPET
jgi:hypothetical protein